MLFLLRPFLFIFLSFEQKNRCADLLGFFSKGMEVKICNLLGKVCSFKYDKTRQYLVFMTEEPFTCIILYLAPSNFTK
jgi:hypothetical protein